MLKRLFGAGSGGFTDMVFYDDIRNTQLLAEITKTIYLKNIKRVTDEFFTSKVSIMWVLDHTDEFRTALDNYIATHRMKRATGAQFIVPLLYLLSRHVDLQESHPHLKSVLTTMKYDLKDEEDEDAIEGDRSAKQSKIDCTFADICAIRDGLPIGTGKLLLGLYTLIAPVRSDYDRVEIVDKPPRGDDNNYCILGDTNQIVLNDFKTAKKYNQIVINLPPALVDIITASLEQEPRGYLFVDRCGQPYRPNTFNKMANKLLKNLTGNDAISLTSMRHLYLSDPGLDIKAQTLGDRRAIAQQMGHSVARQGTYLWTS